MKRKLFPLRYPFMRQGLTLLIGVVVLLSTTGLPQVKHLCGGIVQSVGIWIGSAGCNHDMQKSNSCSMQVVEDQKHAIPSSSCCKKPALAEVEKKDDCCTNQLEWEPSQNDLAFSDQLKLENQVNPSVSIASTKSVFPIVYKRIGRYIRPPPPEPQSRRRALLQVYRC